MKFDLAKAKVLSSYETNMVSREDANINELAEIGAIQNASNMRELIGAVNEAVGHLETAYDFILNAIMEE